MLDWSDIAIERMQKAYTLGQAYAARNDQKKLAEQIEALKKNNSSEAKAGLAELEGYTLLAKGEVGAAFDHFARASAMRTEALARAHLVARNYGFAESVARRAVERNPDQVPPLAALVEILHACGKDKDAIAAYRRLEPLAKGADRDLPVFRRLDPVVAGWAEAKNWSSAAAAISTINETVAVDRIDLNTLGPLVWSPFPARPLSGTDTTGKAWTLAGLKGQGKNVLVLFFLGGKCPHCMQQLQLFGKDDMALKALNVETIAVSSDDVEATRTLKNNSDGVKFPMPMLADPGLEHFKEFGAFDDFENQPLHGCFLIDAEGNVRYQRISSEPFLEVDFIKAEAARVNGLLKRK